MTPQTTSIDTSSLLGQWTSVSRTVQAGQLVINLDLRGVNSAQGSANLFAYGDPPISYQYEVWLSIEKAGMAAVARPIAEYDENLIRKEIPPQDSLKQQLNGTAEVSEDGGELVVTLGLPDNSGSHLIGLRKNSLLSSPGAVAVSNMTWKEFCDWGHAAAQLPGLIYRGHGRSTFPLRTAFHRRGRTDLLRYITREVSQLEHRISAVTGKRFNLNSLGEMLELTSVAQHHGYPTPFLDWTQSPFIAAFFAFSANSGDDFDSERKVRIFHCDAIHLRPDPAPVDLLDPRCLVAVVQAAAVGNPRVVPQQSIFTFSNVVDIEGFCVMLSHYKGCASFLKAVDIPLSQRRVALRDLRAMGITHGSMYPGIDGTCRDLADLHFG